MDAWGRLFTDDTDFVTHSGGWWQSNQENVAGHKAIPDTVSKQKPRYQLEAGKISSLTPDIVLVHATWEWPDFIQSPGDVPVDRQGIITKIMIKRHGKWRIRASQNTRIR